jgi:HSP20 family protein
MAAPDKRRIGGMAIERRAGQPFVSLRDAMDQLVSDAFTPWAVGASGRQTTQESLPVNVYEDSDSYHLHMLAPGVDPQAVEITAANGVLTVSGRQQALSQESWRPVWQEFGTTEFRRQLRLPIEFDAGQIEASYQNGVLMLRVPKAEQHRPKQIKVQVAK